MKGGEKDRPVAYSRTIVERVVREGKAISMLDTLNEQATNLSESIRVNNIRSIMCVPLVSRARVIGVIYVDSVSRPQGFRKEDLELLIALSTPAAVAIENSMLCAQQELPVPNAKVLPGP
jgi:adenylate cyclase